MWNQEIQRNAKQVNILLCETLLQFFYLPSNSISCCLFSSGAAIDYKNVSVSLCYDYCDYGGGGGDEAYYTENIESIHIQKRNKR